MSYCTFKFDIIEVGLFLINPFNQKLQNQHFSKQL